jgi:DNA-binding NtrC family response regulator
LGRLYSEKEGAERRAFQMEGPLRNLPEWAASPNRVAVLAVSPDRRDHISLRGIFGHTRWQLFDVPNCDEAQRHLERAQIGVVLCESELPDGSWKELLDRVSELPAPPLIIVTSRNADSALWAQVLNHGAYDVLTKPFDRSEVIRIVSLAWLYWKERLAPASKKTASGVGGIHRDPVYSGSATA